MRKMTGFWAGLALIGTLATPAMAQDAGEKPTADTVVATVNGTEITLGHMIVLRESLPPQYQALPDDALFSGMLEQLVQQTVLEQSKGDLSKRDLLALENARRGYVSGVVVQDVAGGAVTDEALQKAYDDRFKDQEPSKEYNAAHILVDDEEKANELKAELDAGADFAELAQKNSIDTGSGANGGNLGWFGKGMMVKPFEDAVVEAEIGKVAGPVQSQFGYHLILVKETRIAEAPPLDDMRDELAAEIERKALEDYIKELTDKAEIARPGEKLDPALLSDATLLDE